MTTTFITEMTGKVVIDKDPAAVLDYSFDWSSWLDSANSETISSHTVTVDSGITKDSDSESSGVVEVWLSGGTAGEVYSITCQITTSKGRTDERRFFIICKNR